MSIYFEWNKKISVGNEIIDNQHKKLLYQVNEIIKSLIFGVTSEEMKKAITFFEEYINEHLKYEEDYMTEIGYPELEHHKTHHNDFSKNYITFKKKISDGLPSEELVVDIERYLGNWWLEHIGHEDKKYYLYSKNLNTALHV